MVKSIENNFAFAKGLVGKTHTCLEIVPHVMHVPLPSEYLSDVKNAMMIILRDELKIYHPELKGIPVAFNEKSARLTEKYGALIAAQSYIHCDIRCEYVVFRPKVGDLLKGVVNKCKDTQITCVFHGCFFGTIHKKKDQHQNIKVEDKILVRVTRLEEGGEGVLSILCSLNVTAEGQNSSVAKHVDDAIEEVVSSYGADSGIENVDVDADTSVTCSYGLEEAEVPSIKLPCTSFSDTGMHSDSLLSPLQKKQGQKKLVKHPSQFSAADASVLHTPGHTAGDTQDGMLKSETTSTEKPKKSKKKKEKKKKRDEKAKKKYGKSETDSDATILSDSAQNLLLSPLNKTLSSEKLATDNVANPSNSLNCTNGLLSLGRTTPVVLQQQKAPNRKSPAAKKGGQNKQPLPKNDTNVVGSSTVTSNLSSPSTIIDHVIQKWKTSNRKSPASKKIGQSEQSLPENTSTVVGSFTFTSSPSPSGPTTAKLIQKQKKTASKSPRSKKGNPNQQTPDVTCDAPVSRKRKATVVKSPPSKKVKSKRKREESDAQKAIETNNGIQDSPDKSIRLLTKMVSKSMVKDWLGTATNTPASKETTGLLGAPALKWINCDLVEDTYPLPTSARGIGISESPSSLESPQSSAKKNKSKKEKKSRKEKTGKKVKKSGSTSEGFLSPPKKRIKQEIASGSFPLLQGGTAPGSMPSPVNVTQGSVQEDHQRQALYHLQQLGITVPLHLLNASKNPARQPATVIGANMTTLMSPIVSRTGIPMSSAIPSTSWNPAQTSTPFVTTSTVPFPRPLFSYDKPQGDVLVTEKRVKAPSKNGKQKDRPTGTPSSSNPTLVSDSGFGNGSPHVFVTSSALAIPGTPVSLNGSASKSELRRKKEKKKKKDKKQKGKKHRKDKHKKKKIKT